MSVPLAPFAKSFLELGLRRREKGSRGVTGGMPRCKPPSPCAASSQLSAAFQPDGVWRPSSDHRLSPSPSLPQCRRDLTCVCAFPQPFPSQDEAGKKNKTAGLQGPPPTAQRVMVTAPGFSGPRRELPACTGGLGNATPRWLLAAPRANVPVGSRCHFEVFLRSPLASRLADKWVRERGTGSLSTSPRSAPLLISSPNISSCSPAARTLH